MTSFLLLQAVRLRWGLDKIKPPLHYSQPHQLESVAALHVSAHTSTALFNEVLEGFADVTGSTAAAAKFRPAQSAV